MPRISDPPTHPRDIWEYATRTLTSHAFPFTNPASPVDLTNVQAAISPTGTGREAKLDNLDVAVSSRAGLHREIDTTDYSRTGTLAEGTVKSVTGIIALGVRTWGYTTYNTSGYAYHRLRDEKGHLVQEVYFKSTTERLTINYSGAIIDVRLALKLAADTAETTYITHTHIIGFK